MSYSKVLSYSSGSTGKLIVGVDFGTTFSGVSYVPSTGTDIKDVLFITTWNRAGSGNDFLVKAPSRIAYASENPSLSANTWGYDVEPSMIAYSWTKLLLDKSARLTEYDDPALRKAEGEGLLALPRGKTAKQVVTDYLRELYKHAMFMFEQKLSAAILKTMPIEFWFTMPAIWSDEAQFATRDAARAAGFGSRAGDVINMIREPEAAAIASLNGMTEGGPNALIRPGKGILVCDCGGGTVDLTAYTVIKSHPKLQLEETVVGGGGKCGSTYIDRNLIKLLSERFGAPFDNLPAKRKGPGSPFMRSFESIKRDFGASEMPRTRGVFLIMNGVPDSKHYNVEDSEIQLSHADLKSLFDPVVEQIIHLVADQVQAVKAHGPAPISTVILVGGFGESQYVYKRLKSWCSSQSGLDLLCPANAWGAVVQGAALRGLEGPIVKKMKARRHYGMSISQEFRPNVDNSSDPTWYCEFTRRKMVGGYMSWHVEKAEDILEDTCKTFDFYFVQDPGNSITVTFELLSSNLAIAPQKKDHPSIDRVGTVQGDISGIDLDQFESRSVGLFSSRKRYKIDYQVKVMMGDECGTLVFNLVVKGSIVGTATLKGS